MEALVEQTYRPDYHPEQAQRICANTGATVTQLAKIFDVSPQAVSNWRARHPEFAKALSDGLDEFRCTVAEVGLEQRMKGGPYVETTYAFTRDEAGNEKRIRVKAVKKYRPPDTEAIKFFLVNRFPERWGKEAKDDADDSLRQVLDLIGKGSQDSTPGPRPLKAV